MSDFDAMIRWQAYARESRTAANSHFLAYAAAMLALQASVIVDADTKVINWAEYYLLAGSFAILSLLLGSIVILVRLRDARLTARLARWRYQGKSESKLTAMRKRVNCYSAWVNRLLPLQILTFGIATFFFISWVLRGFIDKLPVIAGP